MLNRRRLNDHGSLNNVQGQCQQAPFDASVMSEDAKTTRPRKSGREDVDERNAKAYEEMIAIPEEKPAPTGDEVVDLERMRAYKRRISIKDALFPDSGINIDESIESISKQHARKLEEANEEYEAKRKKLDDDHFALSTKIGVEYNQKIRDARREFEEKEATKQRTLQNNAILQWARDLKKPSPVEYSLEAASRKKLLKRDWVTFIVNELYFSNVTHKMTVPGIATAKNLLHTYNPNARSHHTPGYCAVSTRQDVLIVAEYMDGDILRTLGSLVDSMHADCIKGNTVPCEFVAILSESEVNFVERFNRHGIKCWWKGADKQDISWIDNVKRVAQDIS